MPATPKNLRAAPPRRFENYTLNRVIDTDVGLSKISDASMTSLLTGSLTSGSTNLINLGFDFNFDGINYKNIVVGACGWLILVDASSVTSVASVTGSLLLSGSGGATVNEGINLVNSTNHVLVAPWLDGTGLISNAAVNLSADDLRRTQEGIRPPNIDFNGVEHGVKIYYDPSSLDGRRTIVRWNSLNSSDITVSDSTLKYDAIIYENGKIEFRYAPRNRLKTIARKPTPTGQGATIGIFGSGTNRFRDFSSGLGRGDSQRNVYVYGGAVFESTFLDSGASVRPYVVSLTTDNWPAADAFGSTIIFAPPQNRRKVLPRKQIRVNDQTLTRQLSRLTNVKWNPTFDDRKSIAFGISGSVGNSLLNMPTTLPRFVNNTTIHAALRQDLFKNDLEFTGTISKTAADQWINQVLPQRTTPFVEDKIHHNFSSSFHTTSSSPTTSDYLTAPTWSKTQIKLQLPVNFVTKMFATTSSIYYYNVQQRMWNVPLNSLSGSGGGGGGGSSQSDLADPRIWTRNGLMTEDYRGFGPIGNSLVSGSLTTSGFQSDVSIGSDLTQTSLSLASGKEYAKSVNQNSLYEASTNESFALPIEQPFVIEKAVIEFPFEAGDGWFRDKTTTFLTLSQSAGFIDPEIYNFDFGGPALTVALYNQMNVNSTTKRELILTGTVTHNIDNVDNVVLESYGIATGGFARAEGFLAFSNPGVVINALSGANGYFYSGSAIVPCVAQTSNGAIAALYRDFSLASAPPASTSQKQQALRDLLGSQYLTLGSWTQFLTGATVAAYRQYTKLFQINNIGRSATGFDQSGRSIFGREHVAPAYSERVVNPLYVTGSTLNPYSTGLPTTFDSVISANTIFYASTVVPIEKHQPSPYLVNPGDRLVLAISKTRPVMFADIPGVTIVSGSSGHDIKLTSGAINITLYGSYLREGKSVNNGLKQATATENVFESVAGDEPVLDEFETGFMQSYAYGYTDDYVTGSLVTKTVGSDGRITLTTGTRGRVFSVVNASTYGFPTGGTKAFNAQRWSERAGSPRRSAYFDYTERYWDSLTPDISSILKLHSSSVWIDADGNGYITTASKFDYSKTGFITFDNANVSFTKNDDNWTLSHPFEPSYLGVARQENIKKKLIATSKNFTSYLVDIEPVQLEGAVILLGWNNDASSGNRRHILWHDVQLGSSTSGSLSNDDMAKILFGFGDFQNRDVATKHGSNRYPSWRTIDKFMTNPFSGEEAFYVSSPIIRGWKYGLVSAIPTYSRAHFRRNRYGQLRDMLEQRLDAKWFKPGTTRDKLLGNKKNVSTSPITIKFVDISGSLTSPEKTWSQNLSSEATSSYPFYDNEVRNRGDIDVTTLNIYNY